MARTTLQRRGAHPVQPGPARTVHIDTARALYFDAAGRLVAG